MSSPCRPRLPFLVDPLLHLSTMDELDSFLLHTSDHIDRVLLRYTSRPLPLPHSDLRASFSQSPAVTRSLLPNSGHILSAPTPSSSQTCAQNLPDTAPSSRHSVSEQQSKPAHPVIASEPVDGSVLKNFLEEILKTIREWRSKQKFISRTKVHSGMEAAEAVQAWSSAEEPLPNSTASDVHGLAMVQFRGEEAKEMDLSRDSNGGEDSFVTPKRTNGWVSSSEMRIQPYRPPVEIIASPDWLPEGWVTEMKTRSTGNTAGTKDKYYIEPVTKHRFRSRKEVFDFLETGKMQRSRKRLDTSPIRMRPVPESPPPPPSPSPPPPPPPPSPPPKQTAKRTNCRPNPTTTTTTPVPSPSDCASSNLYVPLRSGQPSEWLVYESFASLPFSVFDSNRYADTNVNKPIPSNKVPPPPSTPRPWFFTGPEASWAPFSSFGKPGDDRSKDYQSPYSMPTSTPEPQTRRDADRGRR